ncbi:hypothetical protein IIA28_01965 [candidate division KSB1 bacterium]|nr:hypothetical protein [candidate division KSB1 bacterium]
MFGSKLDIGLISLVVLFAMLNCTTSKNGVPMQDSERLEKIYVDKVDSGPSISEAEKLQVSVSGNLPSPAYTFERFDVKVKGKVVEIIPLAKFDADKMVVQVLVPFQEVCSVENLKPGTYNIQVHGRGDTVVKAESIHVKK